jgi:hypothetical protein
VVGVAENWGPNRPSRRFTRASRYGSSADLQALRPHQLPATCVAMAGSPLKRQRKLGGELLREIPATNQHDVSAGAGGDTGRMEAAREAGLSRRQAITALRVNNVPREQFEALRPPSQDLGGFCRSGESARQRPVLE